MAYLTHQKRALAHVLDSANRPLTPLEICDLAKKEIPSLGIATVYRALKQFLDDGSVRVVEIPGAPPHYETSRRHHHHFFLCNSCQRIFNLAGCLDGINALAPSGFEVSSHEIVLFGKCSACREA